MWGQLLNLLHLQCRLHQLSKIKGVAHTLRAIPSGLALRALQGWPKRQRPDPLFA